MIVKPGTSDPDLGGDLGGSQGRVNEIFDTEEYGVTVGIEWDSITLQEIPKSVIIHCEEHGLSWSEIALEIDYVERTKPRDTEQDVEQIIKQLQAKYYWYAMGEEGAEIAEVLAGIERKNEIAILKTWQSYLNEKLRFPFRAEVNEYQEGGPLQAGDRVLVKGFNMIDAHYGIIVDIKRGRRTYAFPLADLAALRRSSRNHDPIQLYRVWYANQ